MQSLFTTSKLFIFVFFLTLAIRFAVTENSLACKTTKKRMKSRERQKTNWQLNRIKYQRGRVHCLFSDRKHVWIDRSNAECNFEIFYLLFALMLALVMCCVNTERMSWYFWKMFRKKRINCGNFTTNPIRQLTAKQATALKLQIRWVKPRFGRMGKQETEFPNSFVSKFDVKLNFDIRRKCYVSLRLNDWCTWVQPRVQSLPAKSGARKVKNLLSIDTGIVRATRFLNSKITFTESYFLIYHFYWWGSTLVINFVKNNNCKSIDTCQA